MEKVQRIILLVMAAALAAVVSARDLKVESFESLTHDLTARTHPRTTAGGDACALIKVSLPVEGVRFWGQTVASEFDVNEYLVYVEPGTEDIIVDCPGFSPLKVTTLVDGKGVAGKSTYLLKVSGFDAKGAAQPRDLGANFVVLDIYPKGVDNISVLIDGAIKPLDKTGQLKEFLPYGTHTYSVYAPGYRTSSGQFQIEKDAETKLDITLRSNMSNISIISPTKNSQININGETKGTGKWSGSLSAGRYKIEVVHPSYVPFISLLTVGESTDTVINIPQLQPIYGALLIGVKPAGTTVTMDGTKIGQTPLKLEEVFIGEHELSFAHKDCQPLTERIVVNEDEPYILLRSLEFKGGSGPSSVGSSPKNHSDVSVHDLSDTFMRDYAEGLANGYEYVDLGLPSGVKWATCNLGADTPTEGGTLYRWGEIIPYPKDGRKKYKIMTRIDISGDPHFDAAAANWGGDWRMPKIEEWEELLKYCRWSHTAINEREGYFIQGPNGNAIFLPCVCIKRMDDIIIVQFYWSSSPLGSSKNSNYDAATPGIDGYSHGYFSYIHCVSCHYGSENRSTVADPYRRGAPIRPVR